MNCTMSSYANNSFHTICSSLISHSSLTVCDNVDRGNNIIIIFSHSHRLITICNFNCTEGKKYPVYNKIYF